MPFSISFTKEKPTGGIKLPMALLWDIPLITWTGYVVVEIYRLKFWTNVRV